MCGFVAVYSDGGEVSIDRLAKATRRIAHRGPDDEAFYSSGPFSVGFRRLKIIDLSVNGRQPMSDPSGRYWMVFNGEVYNYVELRDDLRAAGWQFRTSSDSEVLLTAFMHWGEACLERLNGMFAFLIWDERERRLFGARDRFGEKPFYYCRHGRSIVFASEIKAIVTFIGTVPAATHDAVRRYVQQQKTDVGSETFYQGISSLEAAHKLTVKDGLLEVARYWDLTGLTEPCDDPIEHFKELFIDSVRLRTRADVPVGACLSGGLDSTSIVCSMVHALEEGQAPVQRKTFTASYPEFDESSYVDAVNRHSRSEGFAVTPQPDSLDALSELLRFHDEPFHSFMVFASYEIMRLARSEGVIVLQNGQGADELLAGYPSYIYTFLFDQLCSGRLVTASKDLSGARAMVGESTRTILVKSIVEGARQCLSRTQLLAGTRQDRSLSAARTQHCLTGEFLDSTQTDGPTPSPLKTWSPLKRFLYESLTQAHLPLYLRVEDRNSMAHSLESRLPMLDHRLAEFVFSCPSDLFMKGGRNKYLLRESMKGILPEAVRSRATKYGFPVPEVAWLYDRFRGEMEDILNSRQFAERGIFDVERLKARYGAEVKMWRDGANMDSRRGFWFRLACLELWFRGSASSLQESPDEAPTRRESLNVVNLDHSYT